MNKKQHIIRCPKCNYEYLPAEIFFPNSVLGRPKNIIRDEEGNIEFYTDDELSHTEEFECEHCGVSFNATVQMTFTSTYNSAIDFDEDYESVIYKNRIKLEEPK